MTKGEEKLDRVIKEMDDKIKDLEKSLRAELASLGSGRPVELPKKERSSKQNVRLTPSPEPKEPEKEPVKETPAFAFLSNAAHDDNRLFIDI